MTGRLVIGSLGRSVVWSLRFLYIETVMYSFAIDDIIYILSSFSKYLSSFVFVSKDQLLALLLMSILFNSTLT